MKRCLIVDDSRVVRKVARRIVEDLRFEADEAADGYLLGSSIDGGDHIDPLFSGRLLNGVSPACGASSSTIA